MADCRRALDAGAASWRATQGERACVVTFVDMLLRMHDNTTYGHIWSAVYSFFVSFVQRGRCSAYAIPAVANGQLVYTELAIILGGPIPIMRAEWVPVCFTQDDACCTEAAEHGILTNRLCGEWAITPERTLALRAHAVKAVPLPTAAPGPPMVVFLSSRISTNHRRIADEAAVRGALAATAQRLQLHFRVLEAESTDYVEELRTIHAARVVVGLFGSGLHNCRFMAKDSTLIELHGALDQDFRNPGYWTLCNCQIGLRYVGVRIAWAVPQLINRTLIYGPTSHGRLHRAYRSFRRVARVNATAVAEALELAVKGEVAALAHDYAADVRVFNDNERTRTCFLQTVLEQPCPHRVCDTRLRDRTCRPTAIEQHAQHSDV